ncbi:MAG: CDGSH iron-sulfur domain-containing protein [Spirochaetes bacterium]|nr:CDGSH iron-sulfur domain-containing protein [Spirochaetota bacterium]
MADTKPVIEVKKNGAFMVKGLTSFIGVHGEPLPVKPVMMLCRCGQSKRKPFCDGTHTEIHFNGDKSPDRVKDRVVKYEGKEITIHDNRGICSHDGSCLKLPEVFDMSKMRWVNANGASKDEIIKTIEQCPSGALSYTVDGVYHDSIDRPPAIRVAENGAYNVEGGIELKDESGAKPHLSEHYSLCRCGNSKNKPFCDGEHRHCEW